MYNLNPTFNLQQLIDETAEDIKKKDDNDLKAKATEGTFELFLTLIAIDLLQEISHSGLTQQLIPEVNQLWKKFDVDSSGEMELPEARKFFTALFRWLVKNGNLHREKVRTAKSKQP